MNNFDLEYFIERTHGSILFKCSNKTVADGDGQNKLGIRDKRVVVNAAAVDKATREGFYCSGSVVGTVVRVLTWKRRTGGFKEHLDCFLSKGIQIPGVRGLPAQVAGLGEARSFPSPPSCLKHPN